MKHVLSLLLPLCLAGQAALAMHRPDDRQAILLVVQYAFEGVNFMDLDKVGAAYHPAARLAYVDLDDGTLQVLSAGQFVRALSDEGRKQMQRSLEVQRIDIYGDAALVKTCINHAKATRRMTDYLVLLRIEGEWRIVSRTSCTAYARFGDEAPSEFLALQQEEAIAQVLHRYHRSRRQRQRDELLALLHPQVQLAYVHPRQGSYQALSCDGYLEELDQIPAVLWGGRARIDWIDCCGNTAVARVTTRYPRLHASVVTYVSLIETAGRWYIHHSAAHRDEAALRVLP
ncbi:MAG: hypothetical protein OHK0039_31220 [Bacteroidia bacterium]